MLSRRHYGARPTQHLSLPGSDVIKVTSPLRVAGLCRDRSGLAPGSMQTSTQTRAVVKIAFCIGPVCACDQWMMGIVTLEKIDYPIVTMGYMGILIIYPKPYSIY